MFVSQHSNVVLKVTMSVGRGTVVVGILLLSFLVWLWRYSPEDEVGAWLEDNDLGHLGQHFRAKGEGSQGESDDICVVISMDHRPVQLDSLLVGYWLLFSSVSQAQLFTERERVWSNLVSQARPTSARERKIW